eukprot:maker-scaffold39_size501901-snap-gene-1.14 protein:Tk00980 transcript:maker-scaffold39_size501901-snap-gene-1.14-mRNA-1 annotation:"akh corazonin-related peptide"
MNCRSKVLDIVLVFTIFAAFALTTSVDGQVTFDRDWLAGSGKRSMESHARPVFSPKQSVEFLVNYLINQISDSPASKMSFIKYLRGVADTAQA